VRHAPPRRRGDCELRRRVKAEVIAAGGCCATSQLNFLRVRNIYIYIPINIFVDDAVS